MKLYSVYLLKHSIGNDGLHTHLLTGESCVVDGQGMVRLPHGTIVDGAHWYGSEAMAKRKAADVIEQLGNGLLRQAETLRSEAGDE